MGQRPAAKSLAAKAGKSSATTSPGGKAPTAKPSALKPVAAKPPLAKPPPPAAKASDATDAPRRSPRLAAAEQDGKSKSSSKGSGKGKKKGTPSPEAIADSPGQGDKSLKAGGKGAPAKTAAKAAMAGDMLPPPPPKKRIVEAGGMQPPAPPKKKAKLKATESSGRADETSTPAAGVKGKAGVPPPGEPPAKIGAKPPPLVKNKSKSSASIEQAAAPDAVVATTTKGKVKARAASKAGETSLSAADSRQREYKRRALQVTLKRDPHSEEGQYWKSIQGKGMGGLRRDFINQRMQTGSFKFVQGKKYQSRIQSFKANQVGCYAHWKKLVDLEHGDVSSAKAIVKKAVEMGEGSGPDDGKGWYMDDVRKRRMYWHPGFYNAGEHYEKRTDLQTEEGTGIQNREELPQLADGALAAGSEARASAGDGSDADEEGEEGPEEGEEEEKGDGDEIVAPEAEQADEALDADGAEEPDIDKLQVTDGDEEDAEGEEEEEEEKEEEEEEGEDAEAADAAELGSDVEFVPNHKEIVESECSLVEGMIQDVFTAIHGKDLQNVIVGLDLLAGKLIDKRLSGFKGNFACVVSCTLYALQLMLGTDPPR